MSRETTDVESALRSYAREHRPGAGTHPDGDELVAYARGELGEDRWPPVQEHLAHCPECTAWLLDYLELDRAEPEGTADATAAGWQRHRGTAWDEIQRRIGGLEEDAGAHPPAHAAPDAAPTAPTDHPTARWWVTAVLAAACLILAVLLWQARTEVQPPQPVEVVYLSPSGSGLLRGGAPPDRRVVRPPRGHRVVVFLAYAGVDDGERFAAEIFPPTGEGPARIVEITRRSDQAFAVDLGTDPPPGQYRIVVNSVGVEGSRELATYGFRIGVPEPEAPPG